MASTQTLREKGRKKLVAKLSLTVLLMSFFPMSLLYANEITSNGLQSQCETLAANIYTRNNPKIINGGKNAASYGVSVNSIKLVFSKLTRGNTQSRKEKNKKTDELIREFELLNCGHPNYLDKLNKSAIRYPLHVPHTNVFSGIRTPKIETLPHPKFCHKPVDKIERVYLLEVDDLEANEEFRFYTVGHNSNRFDIKASHLLFGGVRLPRMTIETRKGGWKRGLWVHRKRTDERIQLNFLPPSWKCNTLSKIRVEYWDFRVALNINQE